MCYFWVKYSAMELNNIDGTLLIKAYNTTLYKGMKLEDLKETIFYKEKYVSFRDVETGYFWYYFDSLDFNKYKIVISICVFGDSLEQIYLNTWSDNDAKTWDDWTEKKEMEVFDRNNSFMRELSGEKGKKKNTLYPQWSVSYDWGTLWSVYDPRSASSFAGLSYRKD